jgi:tight adherence protein C
VRRYTPARSAARTQERLVMAGLAPHVSAAQLIGLCWFAAMGGAVFTIVLTASLPRTAQRPLMKVASVLCGVAGGYALPQFILSRRVRQRQEEILITLPYAIDILSISVEAGMGFDAAVAYTVRKVKGPLADEFARTLSEARLGKPRLEALDELGKRTGVDELKVFISAVIHASRLGSSLASTLRIQADTIRVRRRQRVQEQAMKAPVKMVIPLVIFIFPALLIVILGPAGINVWNHLLR